MNFLPELKAGAIVLWRICGQTDNQLICEARANHNQLELVLQEATSGHAVIREPYPNIERLLDRADAIYRECLQVGWQPLADSDGSASG